MVEYLEDMSECISNADDRLEKSRAVLRHLCNTYEFSNATMAVDFNTTNKECFKWVYDYNNIIIFIRIIEDYVWEASEIVKKMQKFDDEQ